MIKLNSIVESLNKLYEEKDEFKNFVLNESLKCSEGCKTNEECGKEDAKLYDSNIKEAWEEEFDDEYDYIQSQDIPDEEKQAEVDKLINKYNKINEDILTELRYSTKKLPKKLIQFPTYSDLKDGDTLIAYKDILYDDDLSQDDWIDSCGFEKRSDGYYIPKGTRVTLTGRTGPGGGCPVMQIGDNCEFDFLYDFNDNPEDKFFIFPGSTEGSLFKDILNHSPNANIYIDDDEVMYKDDSGKEISVGYVDNDTLNVNPGIDLSDSDKELLSKVANKYNLNIYNESCKKSSLTEARNSSYENVWEPVYDFILDTLYNLESNELECQTVARKVNGYKPEWCDDDGRSDTSRRLEKAREQYVDALTTSYFEHAEDAEEEFKEENIFQDVIDDKNGAEIYLDEDEVMYQDASGREMSIGYIDDYTINVNPGVDLSNLDKELLSHVADYHSFDYIK